MRERWAVEHQQQEQKKQTKKTIRYFAGSTSGGGSPAFAFSIRYMATQNSSWLSEPAFSISLKSQIFLSVSTGKPEAARVDFAFRPVNFTKRKKLKKEKRARGGARKKRKENEEEGKIKILTLVCFFMLLFGF